MCVLPHRRLWHNTQAPALCVRDLKTYYMTQARDVIESQKKPVADARLRRVVLVVASRAHFLLLLAHAFVPHLAGALAGAQLGGDGGDAGLGSE